MSYTPHQLTIRSLTSHLYDNVIFYFWSAFFSVEPPTSVHQHSGRFQKSLEKCDVSFATVDTQIYSFGVRRRLGLQ